MNVEKKVESDNVKRSKRAYVVRNRERLNVYRCEYYRRKKLEEEENREALKLEMEQHKNKLRELEAELALLKST